MSKARDMERAMGMNLRLLQALLDEIGKQEGDERMLTLLTLPRFDQNLRRVVEALRGCDWRIPASVMRKRAVADSGCEIDQEHREEVRNLWWLPGCRKFEIPYHEFSRDKADGKPDIPEWIESELDGKKVLWYPIRLHHGTRRYVVVDWNVIGGPGHTPPNSTINITQVISLAIAEERYFNFDT